MVKQNSPMTEAELIAQRKVKRPGFKAKLNRFLQFTRGNKKMMIGGIMMLIVILVAILAPVIAPYGYAEMRTSKTLFEAPSAAHLFGTDNYGRDVFSRVIYGARISIIVALSSVAIGTIIGVPIGLTAGYIGGWFDIVVMRITDILMTIPTILMAIIVTAIMGSGLKVVIIALGIVYIPGAVRIGRSMVYTIKEREYVAAAVVIGESKSRVLWQYIFPNCIGPIIVQCTLRLSSAVLSEASISYLGYGTQPPVPSWGLMLADSQLYMWQAPLLCIFPGLAIMFLVLAGNLFGDGLRDMLDPRFKGRLM